MHSLAPKNLKGLRFDFPQSRLSDVFLEEAFLVENRLAVLEADPRQGQEGDFGAVGAGEDFGEFEWLRRRVGLDFE